MKKTLLTGDRPTGPLHLGHYVGSLKNRVLLQAQYDTYIMIADMQALTDHADKPDWIKKNVLEVVKDYLSVGIDPTCAKIFIQSQIPQLAELTMIFLNLVSVARLERNPTTKAEIQQKGYQDSVPAGFLCYPVSQAADIALFQASCVPVGDDQMPIIEVTNEIIRRFNHYYGSGCFIECEAITSSTSRLMGIDGQAKASKSLGNAIFLSDSAEVVKNKVMQMYTDPTHLKVSDPGNVEGNMVFHYLDAFHANKDEVADLKAHYQRGGLGDVTIKKILIETLNTLLSPIRERRAALTDQICLEILQSGTEKAQHTALQMMKNVHALMGISYFKS